MLADYTTVRRVVRATSQAHTRIRWVAAASRLLRTTTVKSGNTEVKADDEGGSVETGNVKVDKRGVKAGNVKVTPNGISIGK